MPPVSSPANNSARVIQRADLNRLRGGELVESANAELLKEALRRHPRAVNPTLLSTFYREEGLVQLAVDAGVPFELPLLALLRASGPRRARLLAHYRRFLSLCMHKKADCWLVLSPENSFDVKSGQELEALGITLFGLTRMQARKALRADPRA